MSREPFKRPAHRIVLALLGMLDANLLKRAECYFGGGTRIAMELGEYRESKDIDFLCASQEGYRLLREEVTERSLGPLLGPKVKLAREVRADQYGVRTFVAAGDGALKLEVVRESRISLAGMTVKKLPVECLSHVHCFAEKFLANADRGLDGATLSRDMVDLAFMIQGWKKTDAAEGMTLAESAYGASVRRAVRGVRERLRSDRPYRSRCIEGLAIEDTKSLAAGLAALSAFE